MGYRFVYHYKKTRAQRSILFFTMALSCAFYAAGLFIFESLSGEIVSAEFKYYWLIGCGVIGFVLAVIGGWHLMNPATYEATITDKQLTISYPFSKSLSFSVPLNEIARFEFRHSVGHAGSGIPRHGIVLHSGEFYDISMNYGNNINEMHKAVASIHPNIPFYKKTDGKGRGRV